MPAQPSLSAQIAAHQRRYDDLCRETKAAHDAGDHDAWWAGIAATDRLKAEVDRLRKAEVESRFRTGLPADLKININRTTDEELASVQARRREMDQLPDLEKRLAAVEARPDLSQGAAKAVAVMVRDHVQIALATLDQGIQDRLDRLEQAGSGLRYRGVWVEGEVYRRGDFVTASGSLWHANETTSEKPYGGKSWTLAVKRGRDGKDAKGMP